MSRFHAFLPWSVMLFLVGPMSGCKEDPPGKLVEEEGVWSLTHYNIDGESEELNEGTQKDAFMLKFQSEEGVMTTATCGEMATNNTPGESLCRQNPSFTGWACRCFSYAYHVDTMQFREFAAGDPPPSVDFVDPDDADAGGGDTGDTGGGGGDSYSTITENAQLAATYAWTPLPEGVFGSDGLVDRFDFVQRAPTIFDGPEPQDMNAPYEDPDFACTPCVPGS